MARPNYTDFDPKYLLSPAVDPIADMMDSNRKDLLERMDKLESYLGHRKKILYDNLDRIVDDTCQVSSLLNQARLTSPYDRLPQQNLERQLFDLEQQKRQEQAGAWKDIWLVTKELLEFMKQYQNLKRMEAFK